MSCSWISSWQLWGRWRGDNLNPSSVKHHCCPKHLPPPLQADQLFLRLHNTAIDLSSHPFQWIHSSLRLPSGPFPSTYCHESRAMSAQVPVHVNMDTYGKWTWWHWIDMGEEKLPFRVHMLVLKYCEYKKIWIKLPFQVRILILWYWWIWIKTTTVHESIFSYCGNVKWGVTNASPGKSCQLSHVYAQPKHLADVVAVMFSSKLCNTSQAIVPKRKVLRSTASA